MQNKTESFRLRDNVCVGHACDGTEAVINQAFLIICLRIRNKQENKSLPFASCGYFGNS